VEILELPGKISTVNCSNAVAVVQAIVQTVQPEPERITYLLEQLCWVEVLKNLEHLGKLVLKEGTLTHA